MLPLQNNVIIENIEIRMATGVATGVINLTGNISVYDSCRNHFAMQHE